MSEAAKRLADSVLVVALARLMSIIGVPTGLAIVGWLVSGQITQDKTGAIHGEKIAALQETNRKQDAAVEALQRQREIDVQATRDLQLGLGQVNVKLDALAQGMNRVTNYIERQTERRQ